LKKHILIISTLFISTLLGQGILDVTDYGAVSNDGNDDINGINAAIDASAAGDTIYFPSGTFHISDAIRLKSYTVMVGEGQDNSTILFIGTNLAPLVDIQEKTHIEIANLCLDANDNSNATNGIEAYQGSEHFLHDLWIKNFTFNYPDWGGPQGIVFYGEVMDCMISNNLIENMSIESEWGAGIVVGWGSSNNKILNNTINNTGRGGILCNNGSTDLVIQNNIVTGSHGEGLGIEIWVDCDRAVIEDNIIDHWLSIDGNHYCAARRNIVRDNTGVIKFIGIEVAGENSNHIITDNLVDEGQHQGMTVSNTEPKEFIFWGYNTVQFATTRGIQIQGETGDASYLYFYKNIFQNTFKNHPDAWIPDEGNGISFNDDCYYITFEENQIINNEGFGIVGGDPSSDVMDHLSFFNNIIANNGDASIANDPGGEDLEWENNEVYGNGYDVQLESRGFDNQKPIADFNIPASGVVGEEIVFTNNSYDPDGEIGHVLWDFDDSYPVSDFSPTHIYTKPGEYRVTLLIWDEPGRGARAEHFITIESLGTDESNPEIPTDYKLSQNYPNPFNPITRIEYEMPQNGNVNVSIYNIKGELVEKLVDGYKSTGKYSIQWNPKNISSGQYFYQISVDGFVQTKKMVLLK
tara:strand:- start:38 stop:1942 length:1905 start_codon:yes stop_codon:yes gene_type:complete